MNLMDWVSRAFFVPGRGQKRRGEMLHFDSDWARVTGLAGGTLLSVFFLAITLFYIAQ